jgi:hypothetical protein
MRQTVTDTLETVPAEDKKLDQQRLAEQLLAQAREQGWSWSARTGC